MSQQDKGKQSKNYPKTVLKTKELVKKNEKNILLKRERKTTRLVPSQVE
jgi:hypothetical protein